MDISCMFKPEPDVITIPTTQECHHEFSLYHRPTDSLVVATPRRLQVSEPALIVAQHQYPYVAGIATQIAQPRLQRHGPLLVRRMWSLISGTDTTTIACS